MSEDLSKSPQSFNEIFDSIPSKMSFILGMITCFLLLGTIGFFVIGGLLIKGNLVFESDKQNQELVIDEIPGDIIEGNDIANNGGNKIIQVAKVDQDDHIQGDQQAELIFIEYSDFECPFCSRFHTTMQQVMEDYKGKVQWVYRHFPLTSLHSQAKSAAMASECAAEQGKFWEYSDELFKNSDKLGQELYLQIATSLNLNKTNFQNCLQSEKYKARVEQDMSEGASAGVSGTPGSFLVDKNGNVQEIKGALPYDSIKATLDSVLQ